MVFCEFSVIIDEMIIIEWCCLCVIILDEIEKFFKRVVVWNFKWVGSFFKD